MLTSKIFNTFSAYLCSCSCQYCYHIKQKYCAFFSPKAFCEIRKVLKRRLRCSRAPPWTRLGTSRRSPRPPSRLGRGTPGPQSPTHSTSRYRCIWRLDSAEPPPKCFLHTAPIDATGLGHYMTTQMVLGDEFVSLRSILDNVTRLLQPKQGHNVNLSFNEQQTLA